MHPHEVMGERSVGRTHSIVAFAQGGGRTGRLTLASSPVIARIVYGLRRLSARPHDVIFSTQIAMIIIGIGLRVRQYATGRSLWEDEAALALNIVNRAPIELLSPLDYHQGAPIGFLLLQKAIISTVGNSDYALRLLPLAGGIGSLILFAAVARIYVGQFGLLALWLFAISNRLIYYASEVKQYSSDVLSGLVLLLSARYWLQAASNARFAGFTLVSASAIWFSHPAVFAIAGIDFAIALRSVMYRDWTLLKRTVMAAVAQAISFALEYWLSLRFLTSDADLNDYWRTYFVPVEFWNALAWFPATLRSVLADPGGFVSVPVQLVAILALGVGIAGLLARRPPIGFGLIVASLAILAAAWFQKYPLGGRLMLYAVPVLYLVVADGVRHIVSLVIGPRLVKFTVASMLVLTLTFGATREGLKLAAQPYVVEDIKPVMQFVSEHALPADTVYVYFWAHNAFTYYSSTFGLDRLKIVLGSDNQNDPAGYRQDIDQRAGAPRTWFVFAHDYGRILPHEEPYIVKYLDGSRRRVSQVTAEGASGYLYVLEP